MDHSALHAHDPGAAAIALFGDGAAVCAFAEDGELFWLSAAASRLLTELSADRSPGGSGVTAGAAPRSPTDVIRRVFGSSKPIGSRRLAWERDGVPGLLSVVCNTVTVAGRPLRFCRLEFETGGPSLDVRELKSAFNLSPRELAIAAELTRRRGIQEVAQAMGLTDGTVRVHLRHLFQKTGVRSQVELVNLVYRFRL